MVGSVLMQRMLAENNFDSIDEPVFFTTSQVGATVENTACVAADNQANEECSTGSAVSQLPATGESPFWRGWLLAISEVALIGVFILALTRMIWKSKKS